jgi:hypothetical protein
MNFRHFAAIAAFCALLSGCGSPVPPEKAAYVGEWKERSMVLVITQEGKVSYKRQKGGASTSIDAPLRKFEGDNFIVGIGPMNTTFVVSKPPYLDGSTWKMVVDGVELTRTEHGTGQGTGQRI